MVIADEAHRSQYDLIDGLALPARPCAGNLRDSLPNASFIGLTPSLPSSVGLRPALRAVYVGRRPPSPFTGTPIEKTDANTRAVFGDLSFPGSTSMPPSFLNALSRG
jgi:type I restriction enzyme, R subunit